MVFAKESAFANYERLDILLENAAYPGILSLIRCDIRGPASRSSRVLPALIKSPSASKYDILLFIGLCKLWHTVHTDSYRILNRRLPNVISSTYDLKYLRRQFKGNSHAKDRSRKRTP